MRVSELAVGDRPAERVHAHGAQALMNSELLMLATGLRNTDDACRLLAKAGGSWRRLGMMSNGETKLSLKSAAMFAATFEIARRFAGEERPAGTPVQSPRDVVQVMAPRLEDLNHEEFHVLILDAQHRLNRSVIVTRGILNSSLVHPREVFREAIAECAAAIILVHNHPSGDPEPSADDRAVTEQLAAAGRVLNIPVHDHIIIGRGRYTSFAEAGLL